MRKSRSIIMYVEYQFWKTAVVDTMQIIPLVQAYLFCGYTKHLILYRESIGVLNIGKLNPFSISVGK